jgi:hypothetical protein
LAKPVDFVEPLRIERPFVTRPIAHDRPSVADQMENSRDSRVLKKIRSNARFDSKSVSGALLNNGYELDTDHTDFGR